MKRYGNIYELIYDYDNLKLAHKKARRNKSFYRGVKMVDRNEEKYLKALQKSLVDKTYHTSDYEVFIKKDSGKEREIYKLPYYPDRICQWAIMLQIEEIFLNTFVDFSCASIPGKGIHYALNLLNKYMMDKNDTTYCLKIDIKKFFPNIDHGILKKLLRKKFKDPNLLWLLDEIIDSIPKGKGIPIGNYTSQYFANFYLTYFDHWLKEEKHCKYAIRYMDDVVILHSSKKYLHWLRKEIEQYLRQNLRLELKGNYQVFPSRIRGIDFVGYRHFGDYVLLRKSTAKRLKRKMRKVLSKVKSGQQMSYSDWCSINSYKGWVMWCDGYNLTKKYIVPIEPYAKRYYREVVLGEGKGNDGRSKAN
jgi:RNA-directed DNA polymerase